MGEILPDGSIQGYFGKCKICGKEIPVNIQGSERGEHNCINQLQAERDKLVADLSVIKELLYAKLEDIRSDGKTILDFYACWHRQDMDTIAKIKAERDALKAEVKRWEEE